MIFLVFSIVIVTILYFIANASATQTKQYQIIIKRVEELEKKLNIIIIDKNDKAS